MLSFRMTGVALAAVIALGTPALAETVVSLDVYRVALETRIVDGEPVQVEVLEAADSSVPGDKLTYRISLENQDSIPASNISMVLPVDANVTFLEGSITGSVAVDESFSVDGGIGFGAISDLTVTENDETRPATADDLTNLQLVVPELAGGASATVEYSIVVD